VMGLPSTVLLYNASGSNNGLPYVEYDQAVAGGGAVTFLLEYFDAARTAFIPTNFAVTAVAAATNTAPSGTVLQVDRQAFVSQGQVTIEFATVPGHTYVIEYSSDLANWLTATPPVVASGTRTQWVDGGPPSTQSAPASASARYYRIVQIN
jgi:hypothetical protein